MEPLKYPTSYYLISVGTVVIIDNDDYYMIGSFIDYSKAHQWMNDILPEIPWRQ